MSEDLVRRPQILPDSEVVALAREAIAASREETRRSADDDGVPKELQQPGVTIDLGHKNVHNLPEDVVDIIKDDIERYVILHEYVGGGFYKADGMKEGYANGSFRLAISHNLLSTLPRRLAECRRLRYLNIRYNAIREFPEAVCKFCS